MKKYICLLIAILSTLTGQSSTRQMEYLDRGVVAVKTEKGVFVSWRLLGNDPKQVAFNIYKNGTERINAAPVTGATNLTDASGKGSDKYSVRTVIDGKESDESSLVSPWENPYKIIQMNRPAGGTTPDGANYFYKPNDCSVGDLDGDGQYEIIVKWDPSNAHDNAHTGFTGNVYLDAYKLDGTQLWRIDLGKNIRAGAHYTQFLVYDFDGDGKAELVCKTAPGTKDGTGQFLSSGSAANDDDQADYRNHTTDTIKDIRIGYIINGPEYLTVFNGQTGKEMATTNYEPGRGNVSDWGDAHGNRVDRFLACVAYLDGVHPSIVMCRGYYTRTTLVAWDWRNGKLSKRWMYDSGIKPGVGAYGQGNHNLSVADVDGDGKDEIIYGASAFDDNGTLLYRTGLVHGDAMHLSDLDPDRPGLEVWEVHEGMSKVCGYELHDARTGKILWGGPTPDDNGRGLAADIDPKHRGFEMWSILGDGVFDCKGNKISDKKPSINFRIYWDGDLQDELLDGTKIDKWNGNGTTRLISFNDYCNACSISGTKATPCISADILGDWREEVVLYNGADPSQLILFTTTISTEHRLYTLMHDPVYRLGIAWQNVVYNQPPHLGFYIGDGLDNIPWPDMYIVKSKTSK
ncbi:rhamnogalacturonan lyase [Paludibacter jiangxiensis]|uniref:Rhamnogalacturonan endolyase n=1 Tax=Paludibacter jiangxiensis TaxID=681398 RepID=A0A170Z5I0_9BACT|nr:rhamnogalacturonan lyase [Paludibacter jiangxiensis]GAT62343.1 rhamnogalacturonan endolyase [Paludibacter jiangxiensis]